MGKSFIAGKSAIYHGNADLLIQRIRPESVTLILTDPPYNVTRENNLDTMGRRGIEFEWDGGFDQEAWLPAAAKTLVPGGSMIIWNDWKNLGQIARALEDLGFDVKRELVWLKCLSGETRVYAKTKKGVAPANLKDLVRLRPETVQLWTGEKWSRVLSWSENKEPESPVEIVLRSGEHIKCTANHRWPTKRGLLYSNQLRVGDVMTSTRLPAGDDSPSALDDELVGWFVGLYIAEGSRDSHAKIQISSHVDETERFEKLERIAKAFHGTVAVHHVRGNSATANLTGRLLHAIIDTYVEGRNAYDKHLSSKAWHRSDAFIEGVLSGYLSGNGHFDAKNDRWWLDFAGENKYLANDLRTMSARLGHSLRLKRSWAKLNGRRFKSYKGQLRMTAAAGQNAKEDLEIISIRPCRWAGRFWDVEIEDEPHLFALASGVLTHNSNPMPRNKDRSYVSSREYALWAVKPGGKWIFNRRPDQPYERGEFKYPVQHSKHQAKKPDGMFRELVEIHTNPGDLVLDPYAGEATTAVACAMTGRRSISFELLESNFNDAVERYKALLSKNAITEEPPEAPPEMEGESTENG